MKTCSLVGIFWQPLGNREKFSMTHSILIQFVCNRMLSRTHISHPFQKKLCLPTYISKRLGHSCSFGRAASHTLFPFQTSPYVMIWVHLCVSVLIPPPKSNTVWLRKYYRYPLAMIVYMQWCTVVIPLCMIWQSSDCLEKSEHVWVLSNPLVRFLIAGFVRFFYHSCCLKWADIFFQLL